MKMVTVPCTTSTASLTSALSLLLDMDTVGTHERGHIKAWNEGNRSRHRKRSSSLVALESLGLPSPPSSPLTDAFETSSFSEDIPIIFAFLTTNSSALLGDRLPQVTGGIKPVLPALAKFSPMSAFFPMHDSKDTVDSISTRAFGGNSDIRYSVSSDGDSGASSPTSPAEMLHSPSEYDFGLEDTSPVVQVFDYDAAQSQPGGTSDYTISAYLESPPVFHEANALHSSHSSATTDVFSDNWAATPDKGVSSQRQSDINATITQKSLNFKTSQSLASLKSLHTSSLLAFPSRKCENGLNVPSTPESDDTTPTQMSFLKTRAHAEPFSDTTRYNTLSASSSTSKVELHARYEYIGAHRKSATETYIQGTTENEVEQQARSTSAQVPSKTKAGPDSSFPPVPSLKHAQWLRDTLVELWVDQEGFRAVRPLFYLASVSSGLPVTPLERSTFSVGEGDPLYTTVAEFLPAKRIAYPFHHAPLDRAPSLTRVAICGQEARDFVTRSASLPLREDGVFFVSGTEDARIEPGRIVRLAWRFEYFVTHRPGRGRGGERLLTPLSFSCTPALLEPSRAHKVTVLHIMKKTVLPNIVAQKLEPPDIPVCLQPGDSSGSLKSPGSTADSSTWGKRKTASASMGSDAAFDDEKTPMKETFSPLRQKSPLRPPLRYTKHRRGSHSDPTGADAASHWGARHGRARSASLSGEDTIRASASSKRLVGPIIPRGELMKMFDSEDSAQDMSRRPESLRFEVVDNVQVTLLPAPPRRKLIPRP